MSSVQLPFHLQMWKVTDRAKDIFINIMVREPNRITQKIVALCNLEYCQLSYSERAKSKAEYYKLQVVFFFFVK